MSFINGTLIKSKFCPLQSIIVGGRFHQLTKGWLLLEVLQLAQYIWSCTMVTPSLHTLNTEHTHTLLTELKQCKKVKVGWLRGTTLSTFSLSLIHTHLRNCLFTILHSCFVLHQWLSLSLSLSLTHTHTAVNTSLTAYLLYCTVALFHTSDTHWRSLSHSQPRILHTAAGQWLKSRFVILCSTGQSRYQKAMAPPPERPKVTQWR